VVGVTLEALYAKAARSASHASPSVAAATLTGSRDNTDMPAVSQGLIDFARYHRAPPAPGFEIVETPNYRIVLQPVLPIHGEVVAKPPEGPIQTRFAQTCVIPRSKDPF